MNKRRQFPTYDTSHVSSGDTNHQIPTQPPQVLQETPTQITVPPPTQTVSAAPLPQEPSKNIYALPGINHCHPSFMQTTSRFFPGDPTLASKSALPCGVIIRPLAPQPVCVANFGAPGIPRCRGCRGYVNPFIVFSNGGRTWTCCLCGKANNTSPTYFAPLDQLGNRTDLAERPELTQGIVEYDASVEPTAKTCVPPTYFFLIDVSARAITSGIVEVIVDVLLKTIDVLLEINKQTQFGLITYDDTVHFYNLRVGTSRPTMMVMPNLKTTELPKGYQTVFSLHHFRSILETLLTSIPEMFADTMHGKSCLGSAMDAAVDSMKGIGGKILTFATSPPTIGGGLVPTTFDKNVLGTDKELSLLTPQQEAYKTFALKCSKLNITVDYFFFGQYFNITELGPLATLTGGQIYYYQSFSGKDAFKFGNDLRDNLVRETAWETTVKLRSSNGLRAHQYFGHHLLKGVDLLGIPTLDSEKAIAVEIHVTESLSSAASIVRGGGVVLQASLLYTNSHRQKRIRVATISCPITNSITEIYNYCNAPALFNLYSKMLTQKSLITSFRKQREELITKIATWAAMASRSNSVSFPDSMAMLPFYALSFIKTVVMSTSAVHPDTRCASISALNTLPVEDLVLYLYPRLFRLSNMDERCGLPDENGQIVMPHALNLSSGSLTFTDGVFLLDNGIYLMLWVSRNGGTQIEQLFGNADVTQIDWEAAGSLVEVRDPNQSEDSLKNRIVNIIETLRVGQIHYQPLLLINDGAAGSEKFSNCLIEDKAKELPSYFEFVQTVQTQVCGIQKTQSRK